MRRRRRNVLWATLLAVSASIALVGVVLRWLPAGDGDNGLAAPGAAASLTLSGAEPAFDDYFSTGIHALEVGMAGNAREMFEAARRLRPHVPEVHVNLGFAYLALANAAAAEASFRKAIDLRPGQLNAYFGWAESLELLGDLPGALGAMRTYVHLAPEDDPFRVRAMSALWEWEARTAQAPADGPEGADGEGEPR